MSNIGSKKLHVMWHCRCAHLHRISIILLEYAQMKTTIVGCYTRLDPNFMKRCKKTCEKELRLIFDILSFRIKWPLGKLSSTRTLNIYLMSIHLKSITLIYAYILKANIEIFSTVVEQIN